MSIESMNDLKYQMVNIPGGEIELRDDRIKSKWNVKIKPFLLQRYPVTTNLYYTITNHALHSHAVDQKPVVNKS